MRTVNSEAWPALPYEAWKDTYATLHMWTQVAGKVALAQAPSLNHSWAIALQITPRGLSTRPLPHGQRSFTMEFDFVEHELAIRSSDGAAGRRPAGAMGFPARNQPTPDYYDCSESTPPHPGKPGRGDRNSTAGQFHIDLSAARTIV